MNFEDLLRRAKEGEWYFVGLLGLKLDGLMVRG